MSGKVMELGRIDWIFTPGLLIAIIGIISIFLNDFTPLIHFDLALKSVTILRNNSEIGIRDVATVCCCASHVNELILIGFVDIVRLNGPDLLAALSHALCKGHHFFLILPNQNQ